MQNAEELLTSSDLNLTLGEFVISVSILVISIQDLSSAEKQSNLANMNTP